MKLTLCLIAACLTLAAVNEAAIARANFSNKYYPGRCVLSLMNMLKPGDKGKVPDHPCAGLICLEDGFVEFETCPVEAPPTNCQWADFVNTNRTYPECCERTFNCTPVV